MRYIIIIFLSFSLLVTPLGCANITVHPPPLSEETRAKLGNIGIASAVFIPDSNLLAFAKGRTSGTIKGLAGGTIGGAAAGALATIGYATSFGILFAPALLIATAVGALSGGVAGTIVGFTESIPAEKAKEIETALTKALSELKIQETMRSHFLKVSSEQTPHRLVIIDELGPTTIEQKVNYSSLTGKGIDTILELSVLAIDFEDKGGEDPSLGLLITVRTKLIRLVDDSVIYANELKYRSAKRKLSYWLQDNSQPFMKELEQAYQGLSEKIVEELFLIYDLP